MNGLIKKLHFERHSLILVLNSPPEFTPVLNELKTNTTTHTKINSKKAYPAAIVFLQTAAEVEKAGMAVIDQLEEDAVLWMAYPKKSSKKYTAQISRDSGWKSFGDKGFEGVAMVAIDEDWSALRFRKAEHIKTMTRRTSFAMSETGKKKTVNKSNKASR